MNILGVILLFLCTFSVESVEIFGVVKNIEANSDREFALKVGNESIKITIKKDASFRVKVPKFDKYEVWASYVVADPALTTTKEFHKLTKWAKHSELNLTTKNDNVIDNHANALLGELILPVDKVNNRYIATIADAIEPKHFAFCPNNYNDRIFVIDLFGIENLEMVKYILLTELPANKKYYKEFRNPKVGKERFDLKDFVPY